MLGTLRIKVEKGVKSVLWELPASTQWELKDSQRHVYILEQLDYSTIKYDCKVHFTQYLGKNILHGFEN